MTRRADVPPRHEVEQMYVVDNLSMASVGRHYGVGCQTVRRWLRIFGIVKHKPPEKYRTPEKTKLIKLFFDDGLSVQQIADKYGCSHCVVRRWFSRYEITCATRNTTRCYRDKRSDEDRLVHNVGAVPWTKAGIARVLE